MPLTQEILIAIVINVLVYVFGFGVIKKIGGIRYNLTYVFSLLLFFIYYFITPIIFYFLGRSTIWGDEGPNQGVGVKILDYYGKTLIYYGIANLFFILGYIFFKRKNIQIEQLDEPKKDVVQRAIIISFILCTGVVFSNYLAEGINPLDIFLGDTDSAIGGVTGSSNYLRNFADSLIAINICAFYFKVKNKYLVPMILISVLLFFLMGFRYRIILLALGFIFNYLLTTKKKIDILKSVIFLLFFSYSLLFITYNRYVFANGRWDEFTASPLQFEYSTFLEQTRGMLDDITIIKYYEENPNAWHDNGITFTYFIIRAIPRALIGDKLKDSFYPFPAQTIIYEAYDVQWAWGLGNTGEAPLHYAYFVIAGGLPFLFFGSFFTGILLFLFKSKYYPNNTKNTILTILLTCGMFQWITRGYFPGFVDHMVFMLIGYGMVKLILFGLLTYSKGKQTLKLN